ncbi:uncharacterized protein LOC127853022 isoform X2 [Dreissena polymorpha]|uniref:uncharacterized protein LOC127853022 isoform X2 n=1 Tax=Dreissena polymorpha TaxID=45954 RepID=UPI0022643051|nr:uncharacterized protein LOC127853022 isoform X2 [Dreissena polymorpha]XP_052243101.1 uncharacterized protein LOC127853022 isoform X2 [Dreissena polymorpha]XP_052243102.1 uncharacterized protein LOC127853022 isoform X2 [Dreissena polymorpha]XP_052243103.1 uncharacterized protein LOC127853022 isoform X2 [Dreissena polymorpha]XP_052243104.1 uncharacterized protein LOC127853022 isoform X2 [Dreissena polymorpha]
MLQDYLWDYNDNFADIPDEIQLAHVVEVITSPEDADAQIALRGELETLVPTPIIEREMPSEESISPISNSDGTYPMDSTDTVDLRKEKTNAIELAKPPNGFISPLSSSARSGCYGIEKTLYPAPHITIDTSEPTDGNVCLDLSKTGPNAPSDRDSKRLHYSGGSSFDLTKIGGYGTTGYMGASGQAPYFQMPRIKLQPGLGIDPTVSYNPDMECHYNPPIPKPLAPVVIPTPTYKTIELYAPYVAQNGLASHGSSPEQRSDASGDFRNVEVEEVPDSRIPLTVTSQDDDVDSGTESIDSKDSDSSLRLSPGNDDTPESKDKSDRKRPGRKKGQVSKVYHLWEFIRDVLNDPRYSGTVIKWENEEDGIFRVCQSEVAASMWGAKKNNRTKMTYEKMSRSIRYSRKEGYFDDLPKNKGYPKKLCFKFGKKALGWKLKKQSERL